VGSSSWATCARTPNADSSGDDNDGDGRALIDNRGWYVCIGIEGAVEEIGATRAAIGFKTFSWECRLFNLDRRRLGSGDLNELRNILKRYSSSELSRCS
jgi:hypothetical protein